MIKENVKNRLIIRLTSILDAFKQYDKVCKRNIIKNAIKDLEEEIEMVKNL